MGSKDFCLIGLSVCLQTFYHGEPLKANVEVTNSSSRNIKDISLSGDLLSIPQRFTPVHTCLYLFTPVSTCSHLFIPVHTCFYLFTPVSTCSHLFLPFHTCFYLFTPVYTFSHLFLPVHTCFYLFTPVYTFSHLFIPVHTRFYLFTPVSTCFYLFTPVSTCSHLFTPVSLVFRSLLSTGLVVVTLRFHVTQQVNMWQVFGPVSPQSVEMFVHVSKVCTQSLVVFMLERL